MINDNYRQWFLEYVKKFGNDLEIIIKKEHSLRVENRMKLLFLNLELTNDYVILGDFIGLFHDIGRFEQWIRYRTYNDAKSVDHADFSAYSLIKNNILSRIISNRQYDSLIYDSIKYHNKLSLPSRLSVKSEDIFENQLGLDEYLNKGKDSYDIINSLYAMAIRDMDKIDILYQYLLSPYLLKTDFLPVSELVKQDFLNNNPINKNSRKNLNDVMVLRLSFINDMNLTSSLKIVKNNEFLKKIRYIFPDKENVNLFFDYIEYRLNDLIAKNDGRQYVLKK